MKQLYTVCGKLSVHYLRANVVMLHSIFLLSQCTINFLKF